MYPKTYLGMEKERQKWEGERLIYFIKNDRNIFIS